MTPPVLTVLNSLSLSPHHLYLHNPFISHFPTKLLCSYIISPMDSALISSFTIRGFIALFPLNLPTKVFIHVSLLSHVPQSSTGSSSYVLSFSFLHAFRESRVLLSLISHACCISLQFHLPWFYLSLSLTFFEKHFVLTSHIFHPDCIPFQFQLPCFYLSLSFTLSNNKFLFLFHLSNAWLVLLQFHLSWFYVYLSFIFADKKFIFMPHFSLACCIPIQCHHWFCLHDNIS